VQNLPRSNDPRLIVGTDGFSDAGVFEIAPDLLLVHSLDFFAPLVDDPYTFGQIAAANSLSDVFAMGGVPATAMNIVCYPDNELGLDVLTEILRGGTDKVHEAAAAIVGGHSVRDKEIMYGLSITGVVSKDQLMTNSGAQVGDVLVLTKKLGTGFITTAMKKNRCPEESAAEAIAGMASLNLVASQAAKRFQANAVTDLTGFGLAVHACDMAQASQVTFQIELDKLSILPSALELAAKGFVTRASHTNAAHGKSQVKVSETANVGTMEILFDPQTSGGLLISVPKDRAADLVDEIVTRSQQPAHIIGSVQARSEYALIVI